MDIFNNKKIEDNLEHQLSYANKNISIKANNFQFLIMLPEINKEHLGWHQDSQYFDRGLNNKLSIVIWTPFNTTNTGYSGTLEMIEGSHLLGPIQHKKNNFTIRKKVNLDRRGTYYIELDEKIKFYKKIKKETPSGNSIIFNSDLIHKTGQQNNDIIRFTAIWRYNFFSN